MAQTDISEERRKGGFCSKTDLVWTARNFRLSRRSLDAGAANQGGCESRIWTYFLASRSYRSRVRYRWLRVQDLNLRAISPPRDEDRLW
jgi:hypothetical protein